MMFRAAKIAALRGPTLREGSVVKKEKTKGKGKGVRAKKEGA